MNLLFDKTQTPSMSAAELCAAFGVSNSVGAVKAKAVRDALAMGQMEPQWYRPSKMEDNPLAWMIMVNGLSVDARHLRRELQEAAYAKGLIPYVPEPRPSMGSGVLGFKSMNTETAKALQPASTVKAADSPWVQTPTQNGHAEALRVGEVGGWTRPEHQGPVRRVAASHQRFTGNPSALVSGAL